MKVYGFGILFLLFLVFLSCKSETNMELFCPKSSFSSPFPKRAINLSWRLGDSLLIEQKILSGYRQDTIADSLVKREVYQTDTLHLNVIFDRTNRYNFLIDTKNSDTIFSGLVSAYRGMFYLSKEKNDTTWWIGAINIEGDSIQGLTDVKHQMCDLDNYLEVNADSPLIGNYDSLLGQHKLLAEKKTIKEVYSEILKAYPKGLILNSAAEVPVISWKEMEKQASLEHMYMPENAPLVESVYPNPAKEKIEIEFSSADRMQLELIDLQGRVVYSQITNAENFILSVTRFNPGQYILRVTDPEQESYELHRIVIE